MKKQILALSVVILFCLPVTPTVAAQSTIPSHVNHHLDGGWVEDIDNITVLHVSGSHYDMGYQHGYLLKEEVQQNVRAFLSYAEDFISYAQLLAYWDQMEPYIPQVYIEELQGMADGANISFDDIAASITAIEYADHGCFGIAAWGPATESGELIHARSFDLPSIVQDPVSGIYPYENAILVVRKPDNGTASLAPSFAGSFHTGGGINDHGIALGIQICWSKDQTFSGCPYHFRVQQVLDSATSAEEALQILNSNTTHGFNFIVSQATPPLGYVVEQSANHTYVGTYNDPIEDTTPFYSIDHVVRRTNCFIDPTIAATQRTRYDPTGIIAFLNLVFYKQTNAPYFAIYRLYDSVSNELSDHVGNLDLNITMTGLRTGYQADNDLLFRLIKILGKGTGMAEAWNQWTATPANGNIVVSYASRQHHAYETTIHFFNFYTLLDAEPPS